MNINRSGSIAAVIVGLLFSQLAIGQLPREKVITESMFRPPNQLGNQRHLAIYRSDSASSGRIVWDRNLTAFGLPVPANGRGYNCGYDTALKILVEIRESFGVDSTYQYLWAENQQIVLDACERRSVRTPISIIPYPLQSPLRAEGDFEYQLASLNFYQRNLDLALSGYRQLANDKNSPMSARAAYMVMRTLKYLRRNEEAYAMAETILADAGLEKIHDITSNYRFVIGYRNSGQVADEHLEWLLDLVKTAPEISVDSVTAYQDALDAGRQLDSYFPYLDKENKEVDWWLRSEVPQFPKMRAVFELSKSDEFVDWLQASWALNVLETDWLWSLHETGPYWEQNSRIVQHALNRWNAGDGLHWLQVVAQRVQPLEFATEQVLASYEEMLGTPGLQEETVEYKSIVVDLWLQSIRLHLGRSEYRSAIERVFSFPLVNEESAGRYQSLWPKLVVDEHPNSTSRKPSITAAQLVLRWLIYVGEHELARELLERVFEKFTNSYSISIDEAFHAYQFLLAGDWSEVISNFGIGRGRWSGTNSYESAAINLLPAAELISISENHDKFTAVQKGILTRVAFTRVALLEDKEAIEEYGNIAAFSNAEFRDAISTIIGSGDHSLLLDLFLGIPRFRITPNFSKGWNNSFFQTRLGGHEIDIWNHNDNNWWCGNDFDDRVSHFYRTLRIRPRASREFSGSWIRTNESIERRYESGQTDYLSTHPVFSRVDLEEEALLMEVGSGPEYLSKRVIERDFKMRWQFWSRGSKERQAKSLYLAVRATRYGCEKSGPHGEYSKEAFRLLKKHYPDSTWSERTPYWFN